MLKRLLLLLISLQVSSAAAEPREITPESLEAFFTSAWLVQKQRYDLSGAIFTVVKDDEVVFNSGFGLADQEQRIPVNADTHLFRIASISKPFTWIAVMQMVEAGKLDLDKDLNEYLTEFQIPATYPEPITMRHLFNHTAGFEENVLDLGRRSADDLLPLGEYLADHLPDRVRPVGEFSSYSNHSTALAAHIIEIVSGQDWSSYIEQNILNPLSMNRTVARHPLPELLAKDRALSYQFRGGEWVEQEFLHWFIYPAGMMSTTGSDMAKFMLSLLNEGAGVMTPETHAKMLEPTYRPYPQANAWMHGFQESNQNGLFAYGHNGDLNGYHSGMVLLPEHNFGFFASYNSTDGGRAQADMRAALMDFYFPEGLHPVRQPPENAHLEQQAYHGTYATLRRDFTDVAKLVMLVNSTEVSTNHEGYLTLSSPGRTNQYVSLGDDRFVYRHGYSEIRFVRDESGRVTHMQSGSFPAGSFDKLARNAQPGTHRLLFALVLFVALGYLIYWPVRFVRRQIYNVQTATLAPSLYLTGWFIAFGILYSTVQLFLGLQNQEQFYFEVPRSIQVTLAINLLTAIAGCAFAALVAFQLIRGNGSTMERVNFGVFGVSCLVFTWLGLHWNTLSWYF